MRPWHGLAPSNLFGCIDIHPVPAEVAADLRVCHCPDERFGKCYYQ
jgi:hypothetical protein